MSVSTLKVVLFEGEGTAQLDPEMRFKLAQRCLEEGLRLSRATCLCQIRAGEGENLLLLARFGEQMKQNLHRITSDRLSAQDITGQDIETVMGHVHSARGAMGPAGTDRWVPWFPVIDAEKCTHCGKCLSFCLFGVFKRSPEGKISVGRPGKCKTNCPACGRVCPAGAIVFPKYAQAPINGGHCETPSQPVQVDLEALAGQDVYAALRNRSAGKSAPDRSAACDCLSRLSEQLDIPAEVLESLGGSRSGKARDA